MVIPSWTWVISAGHWSYLTGHGHLKPANGHLSWTWRWTWVILAGHWSSLTGHGHPKLDMGHLKLDMGHLSWTWVILAVRWTSCPWLTAAAQVAARVSFVFQTPSWRAGSRASVNSKPTCLPAIDVYLVSQRYKT